jgi:hypothetical protein
MLQKLQNNENDVAITVTDGFIAGKAAGYDIQLVGTYVESPLTWTVASSPKSSFQNLSEFYNGEEVRSIGISRLKSGSHTMSYYMSHLQGKFFRPSIDIHYLNFKLCRSRYAESQI